MGVELKGFQLRPDLVKKEKYGITIIVLVALVDAVIIYFLHSQEHVHYPGLIVDLTEWLREHITCSQSWSRASTIYKHQIYIIYLLAASSILITCIVVVITTPLDQLFKWARKVDVSLVLFYVFLHIVGLIALMCYVGNVFDVGDMRETSRFIFLFNSYVGITLIVSVAVNVLAYNAMLSILLLFVTLVKYRNIF
jgi:hypothetical protein